MTTKSYSNLQPISSAWNSALRNFAIPTVMNAKVYDIIDGVTMTEYQTMAKGTGTFNATELEAIYNIDPTLVTRAGSEGSYTYTLNGTAVANFADLKANEIVALYLLATPIAELKYLKTANAPQEGPTKTVTGGQNNDTLLKYGKTARLEITNALGNAEALEALGGMTVEYFRTAIATASTLRTGATDVLHATNRFAGSKCILGETLIVDADTGAEIDCYIIFYDFLPDNLFNLTQDAEGDATVFDMNGDLRLTKILIGDLEATGNENGIVTKTFYSILPKLDYATNPTVIEDNGL